MTNIYKNDGVRMNRIGRCLSRPAAQIPQGATASIFTVSGGNVLLIGLVGEVTVAMDAVATTLLAQVVPTAAGSGTRALSIASADLTGAAIGTHLFLPAAAASALATDLATKSGYAELFPTTLMPPGALQLTGTGLNTGGRIKWDLYYVPLDDAVSVAVA